MRQDIFSYVEKKYKSKIEYLWNRYPNYAVFRHQDNRKWYGLIMDIPRNKLGLSGDDYVDILNVKLSEPLLVDLLVQQNGYFRGYHISRGNWISILLDGTVPFDEICRWIDESYSATASKKVKQTIRPKKDWLVPANPKYYDIAKAISESPDKFIWKQSNSISNGDIVYLYITAPISAIVYKCEVLKTNIPYKYTDKNISMKYAIELKLLKQYDKPIALEKLREFGVMSVRGPRSMPDALVKELDRYDKL